MPPYDPRLPEEPVRHLPLQFHQAFFKGDDILLQSATINPKNKPTNKNKKAYTLHDLNFRVLKAISWTIGAEPQVVHEHRAATGIDIAYRCPNAIKHPVTRLIDY